MSTPQPNPEACTITVSPDTAAVLRLQTLKVLKHHHHHFKNLRDRSPDDQYALSVIFRDAFDVLDAIGWDPELDGTAPVEVPLTDGHVEQLHRRRYDLGATNLARLDALDNTPDDSEATIMRFEIDFDRIAAETLDQLFAAYARARAT